MFETILLIEKKIIVDQNFENIKKKKKKKTGKNNITCHK